MSGTSKKNHQASDVAVVHHTKKLSAADAKELGEALRREGFDRVDWYPIRKGSASTKAARKALSAGADRVLVCGGDGTVRGAIDVLAGTDVPLAVYPTGTANLFATALDLPTGPADVARAIREGALRRIDTGRCNEMAFAVMAGTGLDAAMLDGADDAKERLGTLAYVRSGIHEARTRTPFDAKVTVDDTVVFEGEATCVLVANIGTLKGGVAAIPDAEPDDGRLDIGVVTAAGLREWGSLLWSALRNRQLNSRHMDVHRGTEIRVRLGERHRFELDGGTKGTSRKLDYTILPASLSVCVPAATPAG